jgi:AraC-like DNA-binding protein
VTYREHLPAARGDIVRCVWSRSTAAREQVSHRILPDGCADVIWHRESGRLWVAGPDSAAQVSATAAGTLVGLRFVPGAAPVGLGVPADALRDARVPLEDVWTPGRARLLADRLSETATVHDAERTLVAAVADAAGTLDPVVRAVAGLTGRTGRVAHVADAVGLSERQLHRRCLAAFGYGPKVLHRVLRFHEAVGLARSGAAFADVAVTAGYADQAHLAREVLALAGVPLTALLSGGRARGGGQISGQGWTARPDDRGHAGS